MTPAQLATWSAPPAPRLSRAQDDPEAIAILAAAAARRGDAMEAAELMARLADRLDRRTR